MPDTSTEVIIAVLKEKFANLDEKLDRIESQTVKTNGRVTKVEEEIEELQRWKLISENTGLVNKWWFFLVGGAIATGLGWLVEIYSNK